MSWYKNHVSANSIFAWNYEDDFFAGYDHGRQAGIMSVADHHVVPGKKFWTWGTGPRGRMWDKILTDDDGPYIELMVGGYSDNQPDYSWLQPYETKSFEMYWYPFRNIGGGKKANLEAAVNFEANSNGTAKVGFCTTAAIRKAKVKVAAGDNVLLEEKVSITPAVTAGDAVVAISGSGNTRTISEFGEICKKLNVTLITVTSNKDSLLGRISDSPASRAFLVGPQTDRRAGIAGRLYLGINNSGTDRPTGSYKVKVQIAPAAARPSRHA